MKDPLVDKYQTLLLDYYIDIVTIIKKTKHFQLKTQEMTEYEKNEYILEEEKKIKSFYNNNKITVYANIIVGVILSMCCIFILCHAESIFNVLFRGKAIYVNYEDWEFDIQIGVILILLPLGFTLLGRINVYIVGIGILLMQWFLGGLFNNIRENMYKTNLNNLGNNIELNYAPIAYTVLAIACICIIIKIFLKKILIEQK